MQVLYIILAVICGIVGIVLADVLLLFIMAIFVRRENYDKPNAFYRAVYGFHLRLAIFLSHIRIKVSGREKLKDINGKYLLISNHRSDFDPFVTIKGLKEKNLAFISKPGNFKVPFLGKIVKKCCYLPIDRENPRNAIKTIIKAADIIKNGGVSMGVYPEGTRDYGKGLLPFHDGVFKIAQKAECPVVVVSVTGTEKVHKRAPFLRTTVNVKILEVFSKEEVLSKTSHELSDNARALIEKATANA